MIVLRDKTFNSKAQKLLRAKELMKWGEAKMPGYSKTRYPGETPHERYRRVTQVFRHKKFEDGLNHSDILEHKNWGLRGKDPYMVKSEMKKAGEMKKYDHGWDRDKDWKKNPRKMIKQYKDRTEAYAKEDGYLMKKQ